MNLSQLRAFDAVVRTGSFTAAAARLNVSQPAVTNHVRALEDYYEVTLFRRRGRGVEPTGQGEALAEISARLFALEEEATEMLQAARGLRGGTLRIAADGPYICIPLVAAFRERFPGVRVNVTIANTRAVQRALTDERCDVTVQADIEPDERLHARPLARHEIIVFVDRAHEWARRRRDSISLADLHGRPMILREPGSTTRARFERACREAGVRPDFSIETTSRETVKEAVAAGLGIGVIAASELRPDRRFRALRVGDADLGYTEHLLCLERRRNLRLLREVFDLAGRLGGAAPA